jgi:hypothetical protein
MRSLWSFGVILLALVHSVSASAQQSHPDTRVQIEQLAATFSERYKKQDAAAIAGMFTKDGVRVTSGLSAASVGPRSIEEAVQTVQVRFSAYCPCHRSSFVIWNRCRYHSWHVSNYGPGAKRPAEDGGPLDGSGGA